MTLRWRLFPKYATLIIALVGGMLVASAGTSLYFSYRENREHLVALQREKAQAAASRIEQYVATIEQQVGWTAMPQVGAGGSLLEQRRLEYLKLLRQVPAITEVTWVDANGREQLTVSRLAMDVTGASTDRSLDPRFREASSGNTWLSPVYFREGTEPYMTFSRPAGTGGGVTITEVNLKFVWEVVSRIKIGQAGLAYVVDSSGTLIAHPDISLVLRKTDLTRLEQVAALAHGEHGGSTTPSVARDLRDVDVLTAHAHIPTLDWTVFVDLPLAEALQPVYASIRRLGLLSLAGLAVSILASFFLARVMVHPIRALQEGAAQIGAGKLDQKIMVNTGDELETLAGQFNDMSARLTESYGNLERKVEERTAELSETLERQTTISEILRVISNSPTDMRPILDAVAVAAARLCSSDDVRILLIENEGLRSVASFGRMPTPPADEHVPIVRGSVLGRAVLDRAPVVIVDSLAAAEEFPDSYDYSRRFGNRSVLAMPLLREERAVGAILLRRTEVRAFEHKQIALLRTFADQAAIAIGNVRLFKELEDKNRALTTAHAQVAEALEQQTATSEVLKVISRSTFDLEPVLRTLIENATRLCGVKRGLIWRLDGDLYRAAVAYNIPPAFKDISERTPIRAGRETIVGRVALERRTVHIPDVLEDPEYQWAEGQRSGGYRTVLGVPMLREGAPIGVIVIWGDEVQAFTDKQIDLVETFADQAVIAIENARLLTELRARTGELTRSVEELRALSDVSRALSSTLELDAVLQTIVTRAKWLAGADACSVFEYDEATELFHLRATHNLDEEVVALARQMPTGKGEGVQGRMALTRRPVQVADIAEEDAYRGPLRDILLRTGTRAVLAIPMLRENELIGGLTVNKKTPGEFAPEVIELLRTFANQCALAIQNARLFREIADKSRQLEAANRHKSEFLANMSHELRTPLNAIIGFSEVLLERMFGEMNEKQQEYLKDIHSSGRHLLSLINDVLDLAKVEAGRMELNLETFDLPTAIHDALTLIRERAARHGIAISVDLDSRLGELTADQRKLKQILLNLISNAVKFTPEGGRIEIAARRLGEVVEIVVSDSGVGIAPGDQANLFEEFRQLGNDYTRNAEGTGLGLALTRKFVELHGGTIRVESEPGRGSSFAFRLPLDIGVSRAAAVSA